jgi:hypothetical protein
MDEYRLFAQSQNDAAVDYNCSYIKSPVKNSTTLFIRSQYFITDGIPCTYVALWFFFYSLTNMKYLQSSERNKLDRSSNFIERLYDMVFDVISEKLSNLKKKQGNIKSVSEVIARKEIHSYNNSLKKSFGYCDASPYFMGDDEHGATNDDFLSVIQ